jgi:RimJ/RimL family protein N-acetyltransferase
MSQATVTLRPLMHADLAAITPWFEDPDTRRSLGGPEWPAAMLALADRCVGTTFRGAQQTGAHHYLALAAGTPVGYIDCGTFDRCTVYGGEGPDGPIILETIAAVTGSIAFVINPAYRGQRLATYTIQALINHPDLGTVELFEAGVEPENHASRAALAAAGFRARSSVPDCEGMLYYLASRTRSRPAVGSSDRAAPSGRRAPEAQAARSAIWPGCPVGRENGTRAVRGARAERPDASAVSLGLDIDR